MKGVLIGLFKRDVKALKAYSIMNLNLLCGQQNNIIKNNVSHKISQTKVFSRL